MTLQLIGRSSSHYTRLPRLFAEELGVAYEFVPIYDMRLTDPQVYAGNPALKLPILRRDGSMLCGAQNICRAIAEHAPRERRLVWPEELRDDLSRNGHELVSHAMSAQVQLVFGTTVAKLPADNLYFSKARAGFEGCLRWLDAHLEQLLETLPAPRDLSVFEASLFCLVDHLAFRPTVSVEPYPALREFARAFGARDSARRTAYKFDTP